MCHTNETDMLSNTSIDCQNICDTVLWWKKLKTFWKKKKYYKENKYGKRIGRNKNMKHVFWWKQEKKIIKKKKLLCFKMREKPPEITLLGSNKILNCYLWSLFKMVSDLASVST